MTTPEALAELAELGFPITVRDGRPFAPKGVAAEPRAATALAHVLSHRSEAVEVLTAPRPCLGPAPLVACPHGHDVDERALICFACWPSRQRHAAAKRAARGAR